MSDSNLSEIRNSINLTLNQPGAFFKVETQAEEVFSTSHGVVNFQDVAYICKYTFQFSGSDTAGNDQLETHEIMAIYHKGLIYHLVEGGGKGEEWTAFETESSGWDTSDLAPLFWLQGAKQVTLLGPSYYQLTIDMQQYIAMKSNLSTRTQTIQILENSIVGLSKQFSGL